MHSSDRVHHLANGQPWSLTVVISGHGSREDWIWRTARWDIRPQPEELGGRGLHQGNSCYHLFRVTPDSSIPCTLAHSSRHTVAHTHRHTHRHTHTHSKLTLGKNNIIYSWTEMRDVFIACRGERDVQWRVTRSGRILMSGVRSMFIPGLTRASIISVHTGH